MMKESLKILFIKKILILIGVIQKNVQQLGYLIKKQWTFTGLPLIFMIQIHSPLVPYLLYFIYLDLGNRDTKTTYLTQVTAKDK